GCYIGAGLGPGPRDGLMTGLVARSGRSIRLVRTSLELSVLVLGFLLGGSVGIGTVIYALAIGPLAHVFLPLLSVENSRQGPARDTDVGFRLHGRAAAMAPALAELLAADRPRLVVADTLTVAGGFAAELIGVPWVELLPHPLYLPSVALPPPGSGLAPGRT